ncbi:MAG: sigma-70 family RNA polymerase sigma factor [Oscillospiraceae bacterium]|nr:sigma-70 family RNA polymerase sigma factor [Oscillospiraceae bacterium]
MADADFLTAHLKAIYGYAVSRTASSDEAEELSQDILTAALDAFKRNPGVTDKERYLWKIAHNTYVDHVRRGQKTKNQIGFGVLPDTLANLPASDPPPSDGVEAEEQLRLLRREIARLSAVRRRIVIQHYYEGKPLGEIAAALHMPLGTVKWHLSGSRGEIEKGMNVMRTQGNLSINPIKFSNISYSGNEDSDGGPQRLLTSAIRQNILYAAYRKPQSVNEIADEMGVSPPYIHEEVEFLMDYNFLNEMEPGKYQTNIIILQDEDGALLLDKLYAPSRRNRQTAR